MIKGIHDKRSRPYSWTGQSLASLWGEKLFYHFCNLFGRIPAYMAIAVTIPVFLAFRKWERLASFDFFTRVYGTTSKWRLLWHTSCQFWCWGACWVDRSIIFGGRTGRYLFNIRGEEHFHEALKCPNGILLVTAHIGNYGLGAWKLRRDLDLVVNIALIDDEEDQVRRFLENIQGADRPRIISLSRSSFSSISVLKALREGEIVAIQADRVVDKNVVHLDFLGSEVPFPKGPFILSLISGAPILITFTIKFGASRYMVFVERPIFPPELRSSNREMVIQDLARQTIKRIEDIVRKHPYQWFNFYPYWIDSPGYHDPLYDRFPRS